VGRIISQAPLLYVGVVSSARDQRLDRQLGGHPEGEHEAAVVRWAMPLGNPVVPEL
jgi:hypothetical protein